MAGNLLAINVNPALPVGAWSLGLASDVRGVCSDGFYFWVTDTEWLYQLYQKADGNFAMVS